MFISGARDVYSFDGETITPEGVDAYGFFESVAVDPNSGDVYVTTDTENLGKVLRLSGGEWSLEDVSTFYPIMGVFFQDANGYIIAGGGNLFEKSPM